MSRNIIPNSESNAKKDKKRYSSFTPQWSLDEIILSNDVRDTIGDAIAYYKYKDKLLGEWNMNRFLKDGRGAFTINFYGPSGTGKSITAEGFAHEIKRKILKVDYSEISGSLMGETEKNLTGLFKEAEKNDLLIFFDEADALLSKRVSGDNINANNTNQIKSHILNLMDRQNVVVIFATNFFKNYDQAFFRRILFHIGFEMPNLDQRIKLWKFHFDDKIPKEKMLTYKKMAEVTDSFAGGDIRNLALKLAIKIISEKTELIGIELFHREIEKYKKAIKESKKQSISVNNSLEESPS